MVNHLVWSAEDNNFAFFFLRNTTRASRLSIHCRGLKGYVKQPKRKKTEEVQEPFAGKSTNKMKQLTLAPDMMTLTRTFIYWWLIASTCEHSLRLRRWWGNSALRCWLKNGYAAADLGRFFLISCCFQHHSMPVGNSLVLSQGIKISYQVRFLA